MVQMEPPLEASRQPRRVLVIHNPAAGRNRQRRLADVLERLEALGASVSLRETTRRGDAERFARDACGQDFEAVIAAGGDGTINEVVNGFLHGQDDGAVPALGIIPLGTANVLALEVGLNPHDPDQIARTIALGGTRRVHLGVANGRRFILMAGAGLDAQVVAGVNPRLKRRTGKFAYVVESFRQALGYDYPPLKIRADGRTYEGRMAVACKGRYYGGPFVAAPDARLDSPRLEICILPRPGLAGMLRYGLALPMGRLPSLPEVQVISTESLTITGPRGAPVQGDGDIVARLPAEISIARETVSLIVPD